MKKGIEIDQSFGIVPCNFQIYMPNLEIFIADATILYYQLLSNKLVELNVLRKELPKVTFDLRRKAISNLILASNQNAIIIKEIVDSLLSHTNSIDILGRNLRENRSKGYDDTKSYFNDLKYLRRDWSGLKESELELEIILKTLFSAIRDSGVKTGSALFLGAGMARVACEHTKVFDKVYAVDKSYSMAYLFHKLLNADIEFYEVYTSNILKQSDGTRKLRARIQQSFRDKLKDRKIFEYIVADAADLPLTDKSIDCVVSVYFTEVIALKLYLGEIVRTLRVGGIFIHFGPLDYFFSDILERLSAEEIVQVFEKNNFEVIENTTVETSHLETSLNMYKKIYRNWFFVAKKKNNN